MNDMNNNEPKSSPFWINKTVLNFIVVLFGMIAAYYTTIGSIKVQMAEKAESALVKAIDKKLGELEVIIVENRVSKDQFFQFQRSIESRLNRIEFYLIEKGS
ncbi:MAG: hypothetical protein ABIJ45_09945 [Candidatus Zixiibacteriota bacterium]